MYYVYIFGLQMFWIKTGCSQLFFKYFETKCLENQIRKTVKMPWYFHIVYYRPTLLSTFLKISSISFFFFFYSDMQTSTTSVMLLAFVFPLCFFMWFAFFKFNMLDKKTVLMRVIKNNLNSKNVSSSRLYIL